MGEWRERTRSYQEYFDVPSGESLDRRCGRLPCDRVTLTDAAAAWPALTVRGLAKAFGPKIAVAEINLDVPRGSFFGIVGPNGAGKTTTLRMATGLLRPDRGQVWVDGIDVWADPIAAKARIGVLPEDLALFERLRGRELLEFHGLLRNMAATVIAGRSERAARPARARRRRRRAGRRLQPRHAQEARARGRAAARSARCCSSTSRSRRSIRCRRARSGRSLEHFTRGGGTIVFSSHVMELVERMCDHVAVMVQRPHRVGRSARRAARPGLARGRVRRARRRARGTTGVVVVGTFVRLKLRLLRNGLCARPGRGALR